MICNQHCHRLQKRGKWLRLMHDAADSFRPLLSPCILGPIGQVRELVDRARASCRDVAGCRVGTQNVLLRTAKTIQSNAFPKERCDLHNDETRESRLNQDLPDDSLIPLFVSAQCAVALSQ